MTVTSEVSPVGAVAFERPVPSRRAGAQPVGRTLARPRPVHGARPMTRRVPVSAPSRVPVKACAVRSVAWPVRVLLGIGLISALTVVGIATLDQAGATASVPSATTVVQVRSGQTLASIADEAVPGGDRAAVIERIQQLNGLGTAAVQAGRPLVVPAASK